MAILHFNYKGASYIAHAQIFNQNGKINCCISSITSERTYQTTNFIEFEHGAQLSTDVVLMTAIKTGLKQYINNFPIDHEKSNLTNNHNNKLLSASPPTLINKSNIESMICILGNYATIAQNSVTDQK